MSEKSTLDIVVAVMECQPLTEEELRMAVHALANIDYLVRKELEDLIEAVEESEILNQGEFIEFPAVRAKAAKQVREVLFQALKKPPREWLGPGNIPGTPEFQERVRIGKMIVKKATGVDL